MNARWPCGEDQPGNDSPQESQPPERPYGDPEELNTCRLVMLQELTGTSTRKVVWFG